MESRVANPLGAGPGDLVKLTLSSAHLFTGAAILYLLPVLGVLMGAFSGAWASTAVGLAEVGGAIGGAMVGLGVGYAVVIVLDRSPWLRRRITPTITSVVTPGDGPRVAPKASCCT
jgi:sigma-E factor negative regulatory protein RseC